MYNLEKVYSRSFFHKRVKLDWRAPIVVEAIIKSLAPKSLIDFGCARGEYVRKFISENVDAYGLEGSAECLKEIVIPRDRMIINDLRFRVFLDRKFELVTCFEVVEHIEIEYVDTMIENFKVASNNVLMSAAPPGQGGLKHVNCQVREWWINKMNEHGYKINPWIEEKIKSYLQPYSRRKEIRCYYSNLLYFNL